MQPPTGAKLIERTFKIHFMILYFGKSLNQGLNILLLSLGNVKLWQQAVRFPNENK